MCEKPSNDAGLRHFLTHTKLILFFDTKITFFQKSTAKSNFVLKVERRIVRKFQTLFQKSNPVDNR